MSKKKKAFPAKDTQLETQTIEEAADQSEVIVEPVARVEPEHKAQPQEKKRTFDANEILPFRSKKGFVFKLKYKDIVRKGYTVAEDLL